VVEVSDSRLLAETENCLPVLVSDMPPSAYEVLGGDEISSENCPAELGHVLVKRLPQQDHQAIIRPHTPDIFISAPSLPTLMTRLSGDNDIDCAKEP